MKACYLYLIKHIESGKSYVGVSTRVRLRWCRHRHDCRHGSQLAIHRALRKYGIDAFQWTCIARTSSTTAAHELEKFAIWLGLGHYNETKGGGGLLGVPKSEKAKSLISAANKGRKHTPEARALMSSAKVGVKRKPFTEQTRDRMRSAWKIRKQSHA